MSDNSDRRSGIVLYQTEDGNTRVECKFDQGTLWLTQAQISELYQTTPQNVTMHLKSIYDEGELTEEATCKEYLQVRQEGRREVTRSVNHYSLEAILAIGYRVRGPRGTQFRQWATTNLKEYLTKGFLMDDERLKNPGGWDYFDELLARIREIRASEKRFYQKVRDLFALSSDYSSNEKETGVFFAEVQNKLIYAATLRTAAQLIIERADPSQPNMALTSWSGSRVRKQDVLIAKNYLTEDEVDTLNRLVIIFLEQAELRAKQQKDLTLAFWRSSVDRMLAANDLPLLDGRGSVSHEAMKAIANERYDNFDAKRRQQEALAADAEDLKAIEDLEKDLKRKGGQG